jgi:hypothetical protein
MVLRDLPPCCWFVVVLSFATDHPLRFLLLLINLLLMNVTFSVHVLLLTFGSALWFFPVVVLCCATDHLLLLLFLLLQIILLLINNVPCSVNAIFMLCLCSATYLWRCSVIFLLVVVLCSAADHLLLLLFLLLQIILLLIKIVSCSVHALLLTFHGAMWFFLLLFHALYLLLFPDMYIPPSFNALTVVVSCYVHTLLRTLPYCSVVYLLFFLVHALLLTILF